jgi:hypothetical protein
MWLGLELGLRVRVNVRVKFSNCFLKFEFEFGTSLLLRESLSLRAPLSLRKFGKFPIGYLSLRFPSLSFPPLPLSLSPSSIHISLLGVLRLPELAISYLSSVFAGHINIHGVNQNCSVKSFETSRMYLKKVAGMFPPLFA